MFLRTNARRMTINSRLSWGERNPIISNEEKKVSSPGIILAMVQLKKIRDNEEKNDITFAAGLPDGEVPEEVKAELAKMSAMKSSSYLQYDTSSIYNIEEISEKLSEFHKKKFQTEFTRSQIRFTAGSTPIIHAAASITQSRGSKAMVFSPSYPLYDLPVEMYGGLINKNARLVTALDTREDGSFFKTNGRWNIDLSSFRNSLHQLKPSLIYLNFPNNPTGYSPTNIEAKEIVRVLIDHIRYCWGARLRAPLILEDIAYATMMHDGRKFYGMHKAIADLYSSSTEDEKKLLRELEQSLVVVHSFSKAFSIAGDRVGYFATLNENLFHEICDKTTVIDLTAGRGGVSAMAGALSAGDVNKNSMKEYELRLRYFESEMNKIIDEWAKEKNISSSTLKNLFPVQAQADAGFFSLTFFNMLKGQKVSEETISTISAQIDKLPSNTKLEFSHIFKNGKINNAIDAALWLVDQAGIISVPINNHNYLMLRFSVGQTPLPMIREGLKRIHNAINKVSLSDELKATYSSGQANFFTSNNINFNKNKTDNNYDLEKSGSSTFSI